MPDGIQNPNYYWSFHTWIQQLWQYVIKYKNKFEFYEIKYWSNESNFLYYKWLNCAMFRWFIINSVTNIGIVLTFNQHLHCNTQNYFIKYKYDFLNNNCY